MDQFVTIGPDAVMRTHAADGGKMPSKACKFRGNYRYKKDRGVLLAQKWNVSYGVRTLPYTVPLSSGTE